MKTGVEAIKCHSTLHLHQPIKFRGLSQCRNSLKPLMLKSSIRSCGLDIYAISENNLELRRLLQ